MAALCNLRRVDCRWVLAAGLGLLALSCALGSQLTPAWSREQFYALEAVQIFAQPMAVIPLLMLATGGWRRKTGRSPRPGSTPSRVSPRWRPPACWTR